MAILFLINLLNNVDFPTLALPTIATTGFAMLSPHFSINDTIKCVKYTIFHQKNKANTKLLSSISLKFIY